jgi:RNA polymerase sigma-54 factor
MAIKPALQAKLGTALMLSPQQQQALRLLLLSRTELEAALREAVESNPLLEALEDGGADDAGSEVEGATDTEADAPGMDDAGTAATGGIGDPLETACAGIGLAEHLLSQLRMVLRSPRDLRIAELLVDALDADGYLREPLEALAEALPGAGRADLAVVLGLLQHCDPPGCGARDLAECLRLQLAALDPPPPALALARRLLDGHLEALVRQPAATLAADLGVDAAALAEAAALLRSLDPKPGARHGAERTDYVRPDATALRVGGRWQVRMLPVPGLALNRHYAALIGHCRSEEDAYLRGRLQEARWLLRALAQRGETLRRVAGAIVAAQVGFLEHGPAAMRPLALRDIAEPLGLHESTVSRATTRKYLRTPRGTFELRHFFGTGPAGGASAMAVQERLRRLIAAEPAERPLSDQALADRLQAEGIAVARRTVAKYREMIGLPPASARRRRPPGASPARSRGI